MRLQTILVLSGLLGISGQAVAQATGNAKDTVIKGATIEIIQSYKPEVKLAAKPELAPMLPPVDTSRPVFNYEVPQQTLNYTYSSLPLRPLALGRDSVYLPFSNYLKLGAGNLSTFYLDAGIGGLKGENYETAVHLHHLSQSGVQQNQKNALSGIQAEGTYHSNRFAWHGNAEAKRNEYYYYGYNHDTYRFRSDSVQQVFTGFRFGLDLQNEDEGFNNINYHPAISFSFYKDQYDGRENTIGLHLPLSYEVDTALQLQLGLSGIFTQFQNSLQSQTSPVIQFTPGIKWRSGSFSLHALLKPTIGQSGNAYLLPDIQATFNIPNSQFSLLAGWQGNLRQNTYEELSTCNPFMFNTYTMLQTRATEVYGGIQGNVGNHISFSARASWWQYRDLPMFINDTATDLKQFNIVYENEVNALSLQASLRYQVANTFAVGLSGTFFNYYNKTSAHIWHEPAVRIKGDLLVRPIPKLTVTAYLAILNEIYAIAKNNRSVTTGGVIDLGGSIEYSFIPRLSGFLQVNNLLNNPNERWLGYDSFGFNIFGGLRLKF